MLPRCRFRKASGNSRRNEVMNSLRVAKGASSGRGRQTRTMEEARAFSPPFLAFAFACSVRIGHVPVMTYPAERSVQALFPIRSRLGRDYHCPRLLFTFRLFERVKHSCGNVQTLASTHPRESPSEPIFKEMARRLPFHRDEMGLAINSLLGCQDGIDRVSGYTSDQRLPSRHRTSRTGQRIRCCRNMVDASDGN